MAKAFEITLSTGEVIYAAGTAQMTEMLTEINGGKAPRYSVKKDELGLGVMKKGKKFSAKMTVEVGVSIKVVEHDFAPVIVRKPKAEGKIVIGRGNWLERLVAHLAPQVNAEVSLTLDTKGERIRLLAGNKVLAWAKDELNMKKLRDTLEAQVFSNAI